MKNNFIIVGRGLATSNIVEKVHCSFDKLDEISNLEKPHQRAELDKQSLMFRYSNSQLFKQILEFSSLKISIHERVESLRVQIVGSKWLPGIAFNLAQLVKKDYFNLSQKALSFPEKQFELLLIGNFLGYELKDFLGSYYIRQKLILAFEKFKLQLESNLENQRNYHNLVEKILARYKSCLKQKSAEITKTTTENVVPGQSLIKNSRAKMLERLLESNHPISPSKTNPYEAFNYKIYTKEYDEIVKAETLIKTDELYILKKQLDNKLKHLKPIPKSIIVKLKSSLMTRTRPIIELESEWGYINSKYISSLLIDPNFEIIYKNYRYTNDLNTAITLLIDNSGSMRGTPISYAAVIAQILTQILEKFSIKIEILGFTTVEWQGGRCKKLWDQEGNTPNPGRLSETRHIIYKSWNETSRKALKNIGLMLKTGILKENIDGEALLWATQRLKKIHCKRRILIVISDGAPVEDMTLKYNKPDFLEKHLTSVCNKIQNEDSIELIAFGINHDVSQYYNDYITVSNIKDLGSILLKRFINLV